MTEHRTPDTGHRLFWGMLWAVAAVVSVTLLVGNACLGELNQDEGWYLYAGRLASQGEVPYRDFAFTQGPVMAYGYAAAQPLIVVQGVLGGRLFTAALAVVGLVCAAGLAARMSRGRRAAGALLAVTLIGVNAYQAYFCSIVKTYSLASALLMGGLFALSFADGRKGQVMSFIGGALMALAAGTRITLAAAPAIACVWLLARARGRFAAFAAGAGLAACAAFGPFILVARENFVFCMAGYHAAREVGGFSALLLRAGSVSRLLGAYLVAFALFAGGAAARLSCGGEKSVSSADEGPVLAVMPGILWTCVAVVGMAHLSAPFPYDDYQVVVFPVFAVAVAAMLARLCVRVPARVATALSVAALVVSLGATAASPVVQGWVVRGKDRLWVLRRDRSPLGLLREVGRFVREQSGREDLILTQDIYLAVEAGLAVPEGLEMGQFAYFPDMSRAEAQKRNVVNGEMLRELLRTCNAPVAAFSGYGLSVRCPDVSELSREEQEELWAIVSDRYEPLRTVETFGQADTTLKILRKRTTDHGPRTTDQRANRRTGEPGEPARKEVAD